MEAVTSSYLRSTCFVLTHTTTNNKLMRQAYGRTAKQSSFKLMTEHLAYAMAVLLLLFGTADKKSNTDMVMDYLAHLTAARSNFFIWVMKRLLSTLGLSHSLQVLSSCKPDIIMPYATLSLRFQDMRLFTVL